MKAPFSLPSLRWFLIVCSLTVNLYFLFSVWAFQNPIPDLGVMRHAKPGAVLVLVNDTSTFRAVFQTGDFFIAINDWPLNKDVDWHWFFKDVEQTFTVQRGTQVFDVTLPNSPAPLHLLRSHSVPHFVALLMWLVGAVILIFAQSRQAWRTGCVVLGISAGLAALSGNVFFIPGGRTGSEVLLPIVCAGFVELALYPKVADYSSIERNLLRLLYGIATLISLSALIEIFVLAPFGLSTLYSSYQLLRLWIGACLLANPIVIAVRYFRAPRSPIKQQLRILLVLILLAVLPLIVLVILPIVLVPPQAIESVFDVFVEVSLAMLALIPIAYGYVIYRHKFLGLDVFFTRALALFLLGVFILIGYGLFYALLRSSPQITSLEPLPSALFIAAALVSTPAASTKTRQAAQLLLYGSQEAQERVLTGLAADLTRAPEVPTLRQAVQEIAGLLEVRQAALWLPDDKGGYQVVEALRAENPLPIAQADLQHQLPAALVTRTGLDEGRLQSAAPVITPQFLLGQYPWIEVLLPLKIGSEVVGLLALGPRVPDGTYNAFQLDFVKKAGDLLAMAAHTTRLFDQVRAQSRAMMETRAAERRQVARELHDGPVQVATAIAFKAEVAADKFHDDDLTRMAKNARQLTQDLRAICTGLRPLEIDSGLASVIDSAVRRFQETQPDMFIENETEPELPAVGARVTEAIYHIATESLTNIGKYAKAEQVWVSLRRENGNLELQIADDGQGFPQAELSLSALARSGHFGLMGLHEWAAIAKGQLQFRPRDGGGTVLSLCVPIQAG